jgi:hypothetical protein
VGRNGTGRGVIGRGTTALNNAVEEGIAGKLAGDFARRSAAHSVADDEDSQLGPRGACILIDAAMLAAMGQHGEDTRRRWRRLIRRVLHIRVGLGVRTRRLGRRAMRHRRSSCGLRLVILQRCDICHFSTPDRHITGS